MVKVFVYGILVGRYPAIEARLQHYERFIRGHASIRKKFGSYVDGELIDVDHLALEDFDHIEGVAQGYYHRFLVDVDVGNDRVEDVWVYQQVVDMGEKHKVYLV